MPEKPGVNVAESPDAEQKNIPSDPGNGSSKDSSELEVLRNALKLKDKAIEELRGRVDASENQIRERLEELQEKSRLTPNQQTELEMLEKQIAELDNHTHGKALNEKMKRVATAAAAEAEKRLDYRDAVEWVQDKAEELGKDAKKFEEELVAKFTGGRWGDLPLRQRVKKAWKEIQSDETSRKELEELKKKKIEFAENGGKAPAPTGGHKAAVDLVRDGKLGDALDRIYDTQMEQGKRR